MHNPELIAMMTLATDSLTPMTTKKIKVATMLLTVIMMTLPMKTFVVRS
mgnify:CR=1 FL=1